MNLFARARAAMSALLVGPAQPSKSSTFRHVRLPNAGVHVTHETAFMVSAVWACIDVIASALASSDWNVYSGVRGSDKNKTALPEDGVQRILNTRANIDMTAQSAKRAIAIAAVGYGNGYAEIQWDLAGRPVGLWPISPDRVTPMRDERGMFYRVAQDSEAGFVDLDPVDVFHIRGAGLTGLVGDDPIGRAIQSIAMSVALDQFGASYFANGAQLGGLITTKSNLDDAEFERLQKQFNAKHAGSRNAFKVGILEGDMGFTPLTTNADDAQLIDARHQQVEEICRWFRVPPHKVAHLLRATNNNIEHQGLEFTRDTLRPWVKEIEQEADFKLFSARGPRRFVEMDLDWATEGDFQSRIEGFAKGIQAGIYSPNMVLRKLGENTIGAEGDIHMVQGAMIPLDRVGDAYAAKQAAAAAPAPAAPAPAPAPEPAPAPAAAKRAPRPGDLHRTKALIEAYERIQARREGDAEQAQAFAAKQIDLLARFLGDHEAAARTWAAEVLGGADPALAASMAMAAAVEKTT